MTYDIRVKAKSLFLEGVVPFAILLGVLIVFYPMGGPKYLVIAMLCLFGLFDCLQNALLPLLRSRFLITDDKLQIVLAKEKLNYCWDEIKEVSLEDSPREKHLNIKTNQGVWSVSLSSFDHELVWALISEQVHGHKKATPRHQRLQTEQRQIPITYSVSEKTEKSLRSPVATKDLITVVDSQTIKKITWFVCLVFFIMLVISALYGEGLVFLLVFPLILIGIFTVLNQGVTFMDSYSITRKNRLGTYSILWDELELVEVSPFGDGVSFRGNAKRLVIPGPGWLDERDRESFNAKILKQVEENQIRLLENRRTLFYRTRNCRV